MEGLENKRDSDPAETRRDMDVDRPGHQERPREERVAAAAAVVGPAVTAAWAEQPPNDVDSRYKYFVENYDGMDWTPVGA